jgi:hypothetical protein
MPCHVHAASAAEDETPEEGAGPANQNPMYDPVAFNTIGNASRVGQDRLWRPTAMPALLRGQMIDDSENNLFTATYALFDGDITAFQKRAIPLSKINTSIPVIPLPGAADAPLTAINLWLLPGSAQMVELEAKLQDAGKCLNL